MNTYHIHITGLVQGVGFRPLVCRMAESFSIAGWVSNGNDGLHIRFNADPDKAAEFLNQLINDPPDSAIIRDHHIEQKASEDFTGFIISESDDSAEPDLLMTPDRAICTHCAEAIRSAHDRRHEYAFTTCLECGPRYSIINKLPYDRVHTTMKDLSTCSSCEKEYTSIHDRRHFSQTNSCPDCAITMRMFDHTGMELSQNADGIMVMVKQALGRGKIVAVKGMGGYLLLCDAGNFLAVRMLRDRKQRPSKPFALLYPHLDMIESDLILGEKERAALTSAVGPIVLCHVKEKLTTHICKEAIAPGLEKLGVMLPNTGLLQMVMDEWGKPLIATSGNLSGSPIVYSDEDALTHLSNYSDYIVSFDRDILTPQDDSVWSFASNHDQPIILRRSRGMAPNYYPASFTSDENLLAMGSDMKNAFAFNAGQNIYVSQFLGDQSNYEAQLNFNQTLDHLLFLTQADPQKILVDAHPGYASTHKGEELAVEWDVPLKYLQHHRSHFAAVLADNGLLQSKKKIMGVIWDGTGYGDDGQIWGGEFFLLQSSKMDRVAHLKYFPQLLSDKMSREPRLSAVSLVSEDQKNLKPLADLFSISERTFILKLLQLPATLQTSSMGRFLDGVAALLHLRAFNSYEGEAAMILETEARKANNRSMDHYTIPVNEGICDWSNMIHELSEEYKQGLPVPELARKIWVSLVFLVQEMASIEQVSTICFSGGVFQNCLLVELLKEILGDKFDLRFHVQLSPNDECIALGQLAQYKLELIHSAMQEREPMHASI